MTTFSPFLKLLLCMPSHPFPISWDDACKKMNHLPSYPEKTGGLVRGIVINTFSLAIADIANKIMSLIFFFIAARHLGPTGFGIFSFSLAFVTIFTVFPDMGLGMFTAREIARDRSIARRLIGNGMALRLIASLAVWVLVIILVNLLRYPQEVLITVYITSLYIVFNALFSYYANVFLGYERNEFIALIRLVQTLILAGGAFLLSRSTPSPLRYAWLYVGANGFATLSALIFLSIKFVSPGIYWDISEWRRMLRFSWPFALALVFTTIYYWNSSVFLSKFQGSNEVGIYNASFRLAFGAGFPAAAFSAAMYPVIARLFLTDLEGLKKMMVRAVRYMINFGLPIAILGSILARPVILIFYAPKYIKSVPSFQVLTLWGGCVYLNSLLSNYFYAINRPTIPTLQPGISLLINLILNILLIPQMGAIGAGIAIFVAEAVGLAILIWFQFTTPCQVEGRLFLSALIRALVAVVVTAPIAWYVAKLNPIAGIGVAIFIYFGMLIFNRGMELKEIKLILQEMFSKPKEG